MELTPRQMKIDKLSGFVREAVVECERLVSNKEYILDSEHWHQPQATGAPVCLVCLAGAMMAAAVRDSKIQLVSDDFPNPGQERLDALDRVRRGQMVGAVLEFHGHSAAESCKLQERYPLAWCGNREWLEAKGELLARASALEEAGY